MFVASIISQASLPIGLVKEAIVHAVEQLQHGADLRLFSWLQGSSLTSSHSQCSLGRHCDSFMYQECMNVDVTSTVYILLLIRTSFLY